MRVLASLEKRLARLADALAGLSGWRRRGAAVFFGALTALAFAPFYLLPLMAVGFSAFIFILDGAVRSPKPMRSAFGAGWWFGFGYFLLGVYWMAFSFFVQAEEFAWMAPFAVLGMPAFLALFSAAPAALAMRVWGAAGTPGNWRRIFVFAALWVVFEYARGHMLTGLPWNLVGQALAGTATGAQTSAWYGVYGLSLITVLAASAPAAFPHRAAKGVIVSAAATSLLFAVGFVRLAIGDPGAHADTFVRIVQPNIPQREKIDPNAWGRNFRRNLELSAGGLKEHGARLFVIWPENAAPLLDETQGALDILTTTLPQNATLIAGTVRREVRGERTVYFNAISIIPHTPNGRRAVLYYDKHHLVPFGEYLPMQGLLRAIGLAQLAPYEEGFAAGAGPKTINAGGPSFAPLICYEAIFPGAIYPRGKRPQWIVTVTNDAWFGDTSGPRQHLDQARLRSIELGLPMARSANTGISALIDAKGRYQGRVRLYQAGVIDAALPKALPPTIYARFGDLLFALMVLAAFSLGVIKRPAKRS